MGAAKRYVKARSWGCLALLLAAAGAICSCQANAYVGADPTQEEKQAFFALLERLPHGPEFYTEEAIRTAGPYLPVLFALTEEDLRGRDLYRFFALSRGLCDPEAHPGHVAYAVRRFQAIRHPEFKLAWGMMLSYEGQASQEITAFLKQSLASPARAAWMARFAGPDWQQFKKFMEGVPAPSSAPGGASAR